MRLTAGQELLGPERIARLAALPESAPLPDGSRAWHASPLSDERSFMPDPEPSDAELLNGAAEPRLVFGHTHLPFARIDATTGTALVNPGSAGMPFDGNPRAAWAILTTTARSNIAARATTTPARRAGFARSRAAKPGARSSPSA